jgi:hypothetical protein
MTPVIEKWERQIIATRDKVAPGVSEEELDSFTKNASNLADVREYLEKWGKEDADINEGLDRHGEEFNSGDDDLEVVITDDEDDEGGEDDEDLADFIIEDEEEDEEDEEEL